MSESYPAHYSSTALMSAMGSLQAVAYALCREKDWAQWRLGWNIRLVTVSYAVRKAENVVYVYTPPRSD